MARTRLRGIELGGTRIAIEVPSHLDWQWGDAALEGFACSVVAPDVYVGVRVGATGEAAPDSIVYQSGAHTFEVGQRGEDWVIAIHGRERFERVAVFDDSFSQGEVTLSPSAAAAGVSPFAHPLDEIVTLHRVVRSGGLVVRGSAVPRDQRALLFLGSARPADTTVGWQRSEPAHLSGDRLIVLPVENGARVLGTPWHADPLLARRFSAALDAVHVIQPARAVFADRLEGDERVSELLAHAFAPVHDPECAGRLLDAAARITECVPVLRLGLPEEKRVVPFTWGRSEAALAFAPPFVN